ncbi:hypothetical protein [Intrasporangium calvum]|uniref:Uncharacterized protein n=1 Tax=Intrasporangium calvum (strain ATCC 23552 / DSM 43043 / JCM 3097 / NBRC 12989 / NCIMB 10167 / NRRL B-3866 / 7 KIP) TaxID=710696 RepID=E6S7V9_INTC7|nr:hypothetical protein [Intrasporangium calvum]ADU49055.1 hypothetical protein Intca_2549 [Intrasporangium calvum DSM 43043]AXG14011.1 hypothetical protein DN585_11900 [Intrasporangium calvum]
MTLKIHEPIGDTGELTPLLTCSSCGTTPAPPDQARARLTWSRSVERGRTLWACERCSRDNIRSIESKLDPDWW